MRNGSISSAAISQNIAALPGFSLPAGVNSTLDYNATQMFQNDTASILRLNEEGRDGWNLHDVQTDYGAWQTIVRVGESLNLFSESAARC